MTTSKNRTRKILVKILMIVSIIAPMAATAKADTWRGTAPFCNGQCLPGETQIATSNSGDGATCWTGQKVLCRNASPTCAALQTKAACYGIIMICDNGHYVGGYPPSWVSCSKYACGMCFGFSW